MSSSDNDDPIIVSVPSYMSLFIEMTVLDDEHLGSGTGFLVRHGGQTFLVTNRHNLSGRRTDTNEIISKTTGACPDKVTIAHNKHDRLGSWIPATEALYDDRERPLWLEHPEHGRAVDIAALPLTELKGVAVHAYSLERSVRDVDVNVADELSIVGFPFSMTVEGFLAIWSCGTVASEMGVDLEGLPLYLIDSRTRRGQSGSPVIFYSRSGLIPHGRGITLGRTNVVKLMGIYSGRVHPESDLGMAWKVQAIRDVLERGVRPVTN